MANTPENNFLKNQMVKIYISKIRDCLIIERRNKMYNKQRITELIAAQKKLKLQIELHEMILALLVRIDKDNEDDRNNQKTN